MAQPSLKVVDKVVADKDELAKELGALIERAAGEAIAARSLFTIGLSGGSMAKFVCSSLPNISTDWSAWRLLFCDERLVPLSSPDSTLQLYLDGLLPSTPLTREQFLEVDTHLKADEAASNYQQKLHALFPDSSNKPVFDLLLLGVGPDGHTASLFPGHALLDETSLTVAPITDSPKPPPSRVTLTLPAINRARRCVMALAGSDKANMVKTLKSQRCEPLSDDILPAARVRPCNGELVWLMDAAAATNI